MNRNEQPETMALDKVSITAYYHDVTGRCVSMGIRLNYDVIDPSDVVDAIRAAFQPLPATLRDPGSVDTEIIPAIERRQVSDGHRLNPGDSTTRLTLSMPR